MKIRWLQSGCSVQGLGISEEGKVINAPQKVAENLINQGIAEQVKPPKKENKEKTKEGGDK